jgi:hypothetical protein
MAKSQVLKNADRCCRHIPEMVLPCLVLRLTLLVLLRAVLLVQCNSYGSKA